MKISPLFYKHFLNIYPPYLGTGIHIDDISADWHTITVSMKVHCYNRNIMGTHFGGSLYSMVDPHLMLQLIMLLGHSYRVWDKAAEIEFVKATDKRIHCQCIITDMDIAHIIENTASGNKFFPTFHLDIKDDQGHVIARIKKIIYVRKKMAL